jgi:hypothetical protein
MTEELIGEKKLQAIRDRYIDVMTRSDLRNEISHSDFILTGDDFRCRNGNWTGAFRISYQELDDLITKAKAFIGAFFGLAVWCMW